MAPTDNDRAREARWNPPDPGKEASRTEADQLNDIEQTLSRAKVQALYANIRQISAQRTRYRQTLERIVAEGVPGTPAWSIARNALED